MFDNAAEGAALVGAGEAPARMAGMMSDAWSRRSGSGDPRYRAPTANSARLFGVFARNATLARQ